MSRTNPHRSRSRGLGIVEMVISLAIAAMLLTAVAAAFTASAAAVEVNDDFFRATQAARVSMNQILTDLRRADGVEVPSSSLIEVITWDSQDRGYSTTPPTTRLSSSPPTSPRTPTTCSPATSLPAPSRPTPRSMPRASPTTSASPSP